MSFPYLINKLGGTSINCDQRQLCKPPIYDDPIHVTRNKLKAFIKKVMGKMERAALHHKYHP